MTATASDVLNRGALARDLTRAVRGEVRFDEGSRALYANDASIYRQVPIGLVVPRDADDVVAALGVCRHHGAPVMARGSGTGLGGQSVNEAVAFDFSKYLHRVIDIDPAAATARVQPGVICDHVREAAGEHGPGWRCGRTRACPSRTSATTSATTASWSSGTATTPCDDDFKRASLNSPV